MGYTAHKIKHLLLGIEIQKKKVKKKIEGSNNFQTSKMAVCIALRMIRS